MASKKDNEKESLKETKTRKKKQEVDETIETVKGPAVEKADEISLSSLDLIWRHAFRELDEWVKGVENRDEAFLKKIILLSDSVKRNQGNLKAIAEQFTREFAEWEKTARDEFLMSTTALQHFFPIQSYENINVQIDEIQKKAVSLLNTTCQTIGNFQVIEKYLEMIEQFMVLRKKGRMQYIKTVKQAGNLLYENQKGFVNFFARQIKALRFPLNKYMEKTEELTNS
ncbi:hypothetical protein V7161_05120 [Neobacillus drentensis]|uniref:hypothetical protein n=1 Tax=Neobacillus drentensis TaxID=220684 RepID=UPI0030002773